MNQRTITVGELVPLLNAYSSFLNAQVPMKWALQLARCVRGLELKREEIIKAANLANKSDSPEQRMAELNAEEVEVECLVLPGAEVESWDVTVPGNALYVLVYHGLIEGEPPDADSAAA